MTINGGPSNLVPPPLSYNQQFFEADVLSILTQFSPAVWSGEEASADPTANNRDRVYAYITPGSETMWGGLYSNRLGAREMTNTNCPENIGTDVCGGTTRFYSARMPYASEAPHLTKTSSPSLGGTLVRYYTSLVRTGGRPNQWLTTHVWGTFLGTPTNPSSGAGPLKIPAMSTTHPTHEMADFYRGSLQTGCLYTSNGTHDPTLSNPDGSSAVVYAYCMRGCGARRPSPEIPVYLWDNWCGTASDINIQTSTTALTEHRGWSPASTRLRILLEQVVRDPDKTAVYGYTTTPNHNPTMVRTRMLGVPPPHSACPSGGCTSNTLGLTSEAFYPKPEMLSYVGSKICWSSRRGTIGDYTESLAGICFAEEDGFCYTKVVVTSAGDPVYELGCARTVADVFSQPIDEGVTYKMVDPPTPIGTPGTDQTPGTDGYYIDWTTTDTTATIAPSESGTQRYCAASSDLRHRACLMLPTTISTKMVIPPNYLESEVNLGYPHDLSIGVGVRQPPSLHSVLSTLCGCGTVDFVNTTDFTSPELMCRSNSDHTCYTNDNCTSTDFNCGTYFGYFTTDDPTESDALFNKRHSFNRLCRACATIGDSSTSGRLSVGQCMSTTTRKCAGVDDNGDCPAGYTACQNEALYPTGTPAGAIDTNNVGATLRISLENLDSYGVGLNNEGDFFDILGIVHPTTLQRWIPDVVGGFGIVDTVAKSIQTSVYDATHCVGVTPTMDKFVHTSIVETPRYMSTNDVYATPDPPEFPDGLTEPAIAAWCAASTTCATPGDPHHYLCNDITFAFTSKPGENGRCVIRRENDFQYQEKAEGGGQHDAGVTTIPK